MITTKENNQNWAKNLTRYFSGDDRQMSCKHIKRCSMSLTIRWVNTAMRPRAATTEARAPRVHALQQEEPLQEEAHTPHLASSPHLL